jgi:hypothetical protein
MFFKKIDFMVIFNFFLSVYLDFMARAPSYLSLFEIEVFFLKKYFFLCLIFEDFFYFIQIRFIL